MTGGGLAVRAGVGRLSLTRTVVNATTAVSLPGSRRNASARRRGAPASLVTFAGLQGGAGVSTATMLLATAVTAASDRPALAVDLAGVTSGGLGGLAQAWSQAPARTTAQLMLEGASIARPYLETGEGVHAISGPPGEIVKANTLGHELVGTLQAAIGRGATDDELGALSRDAVAGVDLGGAPDHSDPGTDAVREFVGRARPVYSVLTVDLGVSEQQPLARLLAVSDLHVWVIAARREDLETVAARLQAQPRLADNEALLLWVPYGHTVRHRELRVLSQTRDCPLVKLPTVAWTQDWRARTHACATSIEALCRLLP